MQLQCRDLSLLLRFTRLRTVKDLSLLMKTYPMASCDTEETQRDTAKYKVGNLIILLETLWLQFLFVILCLPRSKVLFKDQHFLLCTTTHTCSIYLDCYLCSLLEQQYFCYSYTILYAWLRKTMVSCVKFNLGLI